MRRAWTRGFDACAAIRTGMQKRDGDEAGGTWGQQTRGGASREPGAKKRGRVKHTTFLKCFFKNTSIPDGLTDSEHYPMPMQAIGIPRHVSPTAELWDYGAADLLSFGPKPRALGTARL